MSNKPNILLVFADQQHWQAMGSVDPYFETPNLDAFAAESRVFERSFCTTPQCSPSRSSLLTGFYPSATKVMGNHNAIGGANLVQPTIATELRAAGYRTGYFGKWHLGNDPIACGGWVAKDFTKNDPLARDNAIQFLKDSEEKDAPFALFVSINDPHDVYNFKSHSTENTETPLPRSWSDDAFEDKPPIQRQFMTEDQGTAIEGSPQSEWERYRECYREKTQLYDEHLGAIIDELKQIGKWENTIVIVTSDHGDMDAQHKMIFKGPFLYDHMIRVPLVIRVPEAFGGSTSGSKESVDVVNVDIVPTLRDFCGLTPRPTHGRSLLPLLTGQDSYEPREFVIAQYYGKQRWVNPIRMIRTSSYKLNRHIHWSDELYDLENDPDELKNVAADPDYADIKSDLIAKLDQWIHDHHDPFYTFVPTDRSGVEIHPVNPND